LNKPFENTNEFEKIFKEYYNPLFNFVLRHLRNPESSREVVQNTFMKIWENRHQIQIQSSIKSYIFQACKNGLVDYIRINKKHSHTIEPDQILDLESETETEKLDLYLVRQAVDKILVVLKPKNRQIFELHKYEGLTYPEIAEYLGISKRAVEDNISRTLILLRKELKNHPDLFE